MFRISWLFIFIVSTAGSLNAAKSRSRVDSLIQVLKTAPKDTHRVINLYNLARQLRSLGEYDSSMIFGQEAMALAQNLNYRSGIGHSYYTIGLVHQGKGNNPEALHSFLAAIKISEELNDQQLRGAVTNALGIIYWYMREHATALDFLNQSLQIKKKLSDKRGIANTYNNIANVLHDQGKYMDALRNLNWSIEIKKELGDKMGLSNSYANRGSCYQFLKEYDKALGDYQLSLELRKEIGNKAGVAGSLANLALVYSLTGRSGLAVQYAKEGLEMARTIHSVRLFNENYLALSTALEANGEYKAAYAAHQMYLMYRDSILNEESLERTLQMQMQYDFDIKTAAEKAEQDKKDAIAAEEEKIRGALVWGMGIAIVLVVVLGVVILISLFRNRAQNKLISTQRDILEDKQKAIIQSIAYAKRIQQSLLPSEGYIKRILKRSL